ncbi:hypothetical protein [Marinomonas sp. PE14-40]|uniref:hypothetical protein n=1 Tax=Marinomonas sp. PE14-40 TaxID=3060621 RepID=UPI003F66EDA0
MARMANTAATFGGVGSGVAGITGGAGFVSEMVNGASSLRVYGYTTIEISSVLIVILVLALSYYWFFKKRTDSKKLTLIDGLKIFLISLAITFLVTLTVGMYKIKPDRTFETAGVQGELIGCFQSGSALRCDFILENVKKSGGIELSVLRTSSSIVTPSGSSIKPYQMSVGDETKDHTRGMEVNLHQSGHAYISFDFKLSQESSINKIQGLEFVMSIDGITETNTLIDIWVESGY